MDLYFNVIIIKQVWYPVLKLIWHEHSFTYEFSFPCFIMYQNRRHVMCHFRSILHNKRLTCNPRHLGQLLLNVCFGLLKIYDLLITFCVLLTISFIATVVPLITRSMIWWTSLQLYSLTFNVVRTKSLKLVLFWIYNGTYPQIRELENLEVMRARGARHVP